MGSPFPRGFLGCLGFLRFAGGKPLGTGGLGLTAAGRPPKTCRSIRSTASAAARLAASWGVSFLVFDVFVPGFGFGARLAAGFLAVGLAVFCCAVL